MNTTKVLVQSPSKISLLVIALFAAMLTACGGSTADLALNAVYGFKSANKTPVPDVVPEGYAEQFLQVQVSEEVTNTTHLWHFRNTSNANAPVLFYFHGNAENIGTMHKYGFLEALESLGMHVVVLDYPSYGKSTGTPNMASVMAGVNAAFDWAKTEYPNSKIRIWGWSLGAAVASQAALHPAVDRFVLTSPWSTLKEMAKELAGSFAGLIPGDFMKANKWDSVEAAKSNTKPGLIFHGDEDTLIPLKMGEKVHKAFPAGQVQFFILQGRDHGGVFSEGGMWSAVKSFLN